MAKQPPKFKSEWHRVAQETADLVQEKNLAYGDSFAKSGYIMRTLYLDGIKSHQLDDALTMIRIIDKLFRIATKKDAFGEDPWKDILGYSLLASARGVLRETGINYASPIQNWSKAFKPASKPLHKASESRSKKSHSKPLLKGKKA